MHPLPSANRNLSYEEGRLQINPSMENTYTLPALNALSGSLSLNHSKPSFQPSQTSKASTDANKTPTMLFHQKRPFSLTISIPEKSSTLLRAEKLFSELALFTQEHLNFTYLSSDQAHHRFSDVKIPLLTAVELESHLHLHANYMTLPSKNRYIAAQAPCRNKFIYPLQSAKTALDPQGSFQLFWQMALQFNCNLIVDLTHYDEIEPYYPSLKEEVSFDQLRVHCSEEHPLNLLKGASFTEYTISYQGKEHSIQRLHYTCWPDKESIELHLLARLVTEIECNVQNSEGKGAIVHCRAGVGRTGTILTACALYQLACQDKLCESTLQKTLFDLIIEGRRQRGPCFVQTALQVACLWEYGEWLCLAGKEQLTHLPENLLINH